jgi:hypothetical protein
MLRLPFIAILVCFSTQPVQNFQYRQYTQYNITIATIQLLLTNAYYILHLIGLFLQHLFTLVDNVK